VRMNKIHNKKEKYSPRIYSCSNDSNK